jgi:hypothetical protein
MAGAVSAAGTAGAAKGAAKAGGIVAAGGGPEDPVTDVIAAGSLAGSTGGGAPGAATKAAGAGGDLAKDAAKKGAGGKGKGKKALGWVWSDNRKLLTAEFVVCVAVLGLGTLVSPEDSKHDVPRAMIKGSALAGLFFVLALVSTGGQKPARVANALGTLVTATYVLTSADVHNLVSWVSGFFSPKSADDVPGAGGSAEGAGESSGSGEVAA